MIDLKRLAAAVVFCLCAGLAEAEPAPFDLVGPQLRVEASRGGETLPIAEAPNLEAGDRLWIRADLPAGQSVRYLMVVAFLRGATNPPPQAWFHKLETWTRRGAQGLRLEVPQGAEQAIILLAPSTGGDFSTIVDAVRARPGAFVRAAQDLNQASLDRSRLDAYLSAIRNADPSDPGRLADLAPRLARTLAIKVNADCLKKQNELQAACLMENQAGLVLADTHSTSIVQALTSGTSADLIQQLSVAPRVGSGYYSPYVGAVLDIARILDSFHSAQYQYLPALKIAAGDRLSLVLNTPPSFKPPMSVLLTALPPLGPAQAPPLRPADPSASVCLGRADLVLPAEGAPLVFSTAYARRLRLRLALKGGGVRELPVRPDAERGGLALLEAVSPTPEEIESASLVGSWGFAAFEGPRFRVAAPGPAAYALAAVDEAGASSSGDARAILSSPRAACVESVSLRTATGAFVPAKTAPATPASVALTLPLKLAAPGPIRLAIRQFGAKEPEEASFDAFNAPRRLVGFEFHAHDLVGVLTGVRLGDVARLEVNGVAFTPLRLDHAADGDRLEMTPTPAADADRLIAGEAALARVAMKDGAQLPIEVTIAPERPSVTLLGKSVEAREGALGPVQLSSDRQLPRGGVLTFSFSAKTPSVFASDLVVEIGGGDGGVYCRLDGASGLVLEDPRVAVARLDTRERLTASTFGPLYFRVREHGIAGAWSPLTTLIRTPILRDLKCPAGGGGCVIAGSDLFLIAAVSADPGFDRPTSVPEGYTGSSLQIPRIKGRRLYLRLRDDPLAVVEAVFPELRAPTASSAAAWTGGTASGGS